MSLDSSFNITLDSNDASFKILGNEKLRITSLGNVGIGTTSPGEKLEVNGRMRINGSGSSPGIWFYGNGEGSDNGSGFFGRGGGNFSGFGFYFSSWQHAFLDNGNVGIGTTNPENKLHIYSSDNTSNLKINNATSTLGFILEQSTNKYTYFRNTESTGGIIFHAGNAEKMRIMSNGNVGIGTTSPDGLLDITNAHGSGERGKDQVYSVMSTFFGWRWHSRWHNRYWDIRYNTGGQGDVLHVFYQGDTDNGGYFDPNQNVSTFTFTGQHRNFIENIPSTEAKHYKGLIVSANKNAYYDIDYSIKTGRDAITINDALPYVSLCKTEKDKSCYGVISDGEDEETRKYSSGTFVSVSEKQYGDNRMFINSLGEGAIWVSNKNGNLESGDYITTASIPGYGQKQDSEFLANYTVAKITMDCNFQPDYIYKKKLITRNVHITGPDASGNYYDVLNNERLYTIDLKNEITNNKNKKYTLSFDDADNLIGATQNILDPNGEIQWKDSTEQEYAYDIRYVDATGNIITKQQHDTMIANSQEAYIAAFVGCTYHCG